MQTDTQRLAALLKEAELGNPDTMGILSWMYQKGFGVQKDLEKAKHCFEVAFLAICWVIKGFRKE